MKKYLKKHYLGILSYHYEGHSFKMRLSHIFFTYERIFYFYKGIFYHYFYFYSFYLYQKIGKNWL